MRPVTQIIPPGKPPIGVFDEEFLVGDPLSDLDRAFESIRMLPKGSSRKKERRRVKAAAHDLRQMHETFLAVSQVHLRPVLRYLKAVQMGVASKELCEIVHYVIGPMIGKTRKVGLADHARALIEFQRSLKAAVNGPGRALTPEQARGLAAGFANVQMLFDLDFRGHSTAVVNLLGFYRALKKNPKITEAHVRKLFAVGIPSLTMLRKSSIAELVSLSGIAPEQMAALRKEARRFSVLALL